MSCIKRYIYDQKKQFMNTYAEFYENYGLPRVYGSIDGLFYFESEDKWKSLTQSSISEKLRELCTSESKYPTSVSSINRFIRIYQQYETIEKQKSHKQALKLGMEQIKEWKQGDE